MSLKDFLTPTDAEEIKPNLFIKKTRVGYRQINPIVWNNEYRLKGQFSIKHLFGLALIIFICWSYYHDVGSCLDVNEKIILLCEEHKDICVEFGFMSREGFGGEVRDEKESTNSLPIYPS